MKKIMEAERKDEEQRPHTCQNPKRHTTGEFVFVAV